MCNCGGHPDTAQSVTSLKGPQFRKYLRSIDRKQITSAALVKVSGDPSRVCIDYHSRSTMETTDAQITRTLQSIDSNLARANALVMGMVRKARHMVRHGKHAHAALQPWKGFLLSFASPEVRAAVEGNGTTAGVCHTQGANPARSFSACRCKHNMRHRIKLRQRTVELLHPQLHHIVEQRKLRQIHSASCPLQFPRLSNRYNMRAGRKELLRHWSNFPLPRTVHVWV